jgi:hypothetical protein
MRCGLARLKGDETEQNRKRREDTKMYRLTILIALTAVMLSGCGGGGGGPKATGAEYNLTGTWNGVSDTGIRNVPVAISQTGNSILIDEGGVLYQGSIQGDTIVFTGVTGEAWEGMILNENEILLTCKVPNPYGHSLHLTRA